MSAASHGPPAPWIDLAGGDPAAEARLRALQGACHAERGPAPPDVRLACEDWRLTAGGTFEALNAVRLALAARASVERERAWLADLLAARQREMARFTRFPCTSHDLLDEASGPLEMDASHNPS